MSDLLLTKALGKAQRFKKEIWYNGYSDKAIPSKALFFDTETIVVDH